MVTFTNPIFLNGGGGFNDRVVNVTANAADTAAGLDAFSVNDVAVLSGVISSGDSFRNLSEAGNGVLKLTGINTYTGATDIAGGTLVISSDANLGTAPTAAYALNYAAAFSDLSGAITPGALVIDSGATLATNTSFTLSPNRTLLLSGGTSGLASAASNIEVAGAGTTLTFGGLIGNYINEAGSLNKMGSGTLVLSGTANYSNVFLISGTPFYTGGTIISGGTLDLQGTLNNSAPTTSAPGATASNLGTTLTFQGAGGTFNYDYANNHIVPATATTYQQNMGALTLNGGDATVRSTLGARARATTARPPWIFNSLVANTANARRSTSLLMAR